MITTDPKPGVRNFFWIFRVGAGTQGTGSSFAAFPDLKQEAEMEVEQPGLESSSICFFGATDRGFTYKTTVPAPWYAHFEVKKIRLSSLASKSIQQALLPDMAERK